jgi:hypothetical protein
MDEMLTRFSNFVFDKWTTTLRATSATWKSLTDEDITTLDTTTPFIEMYGPITKSQA